MNDGIEIRVKRSDEAVCRVIDGEIVALMPERLTLHALTGCGSRVWELIEEEIPLSDVIETICEEYDVDPQRAVGEITDFMFRLADAGLAHVKTIIAR